MLLENKRIKLRALEPEDLDILYKWENDSSLWKHGSTLSPYSKLALRQYISDACENDIYQNKQLRLMIESKEEKKTIGTVDLYDFDIRNLRAGVGILIDENFRKMNYAYETLMLVKEYAFSFLHLQQLYAYIATDNENSVRLFEKIGFERSGTLVNWLCYKESYKDVFIYQKLNKTNE